MRLHVGSRRDRFMEAILLRQLACRCAGRAFGEAIACLTGTWRRIGVITTSIRVRWVGWTSFFFFLKESFDTSRAQNIF